MDTRAGRWSSALMAACGVDAAQLPELVDSTAISGTVKPDLARRWGLRPGLPVIGGAGDNTIDLEGGGGVVTTLGGAGVALVPAARWAAPASSSPSTRLARL